MRNEAQIDSDYRRARLRALFHDVVARLLGRPNRLLSFEEVKRSLALSGPVYRGTQTVPVSKIIGSVDRYRDFDRAFGPAQDFTEHKWKSIARAFYDDISLPPVKLYKVGEAYFVLDGHHRVSVARDQGVEFIDAEVQEAYSRLPVTADLQAGDLQVLHEYREFLERTRLDEIRPGHKPLRLTIAGGYRTLIEHIAVHRYFMGLDFQRDVSEEEAVAHWYDTVYLPIVEAIREYAILDDFPNRTETDLYLWIIDHLHYLRSVHGEADVDDVLEDITDPSRKRESEREAIEVWRTIAEKRANGENDDTQNVE